MQRTRRIFTHGWIGASALNLFTGGYYPATVAQVAQGRVCLTDIRMTIAGALFNLALPALNAEVVLPNATLVLTLPGADMAIALPSATIEMECCCD